MPAMPGVATPWVALPGAHIEARAIARMPDGSVLLDGDAVTHDRLSQRMREGGSLLHVATHAVADPESYDRSGIVVQETGTQTGLRMRRFSVKRSRRLRGWRISTTESPNRAPKWRWLCAAVKQVV